MALKRLVKVDSILVYSYIRKCLTFNISYGIMYYKLDKAINK